MLYWLVIQNGLYVVCGNLQFGLSDYDFVQVIWKSKIFRLKVCEFIYRSMKNFKESEFFDDLGCVLWNLVYVCEDVNCFLDYWGIFYCCNYLFKVYVKNFFDLFWEVFCKQRNKVI